MTALNSQLEFINTFPTELEKKLDHNFNKIAKEQPQK